MKVSERLMEMWLWAVAIATTVIMACTLLAWVAGIIYFILKVLK